MILFILRSCFTTLKCFDIDHTCIFAGWFRYQTDAKTECTHTSTVLTLLQVLLASHRQSTVFILIVFFFFIWISYFVMLKWIKFDNVYAGWFPGRTVTRIGFKPTSSVLSLSIGILYKYLPWIWPLTVMFTLDLTLRLRLRLTCVNMLWSCWMNTRVNRHVI